MAWVRDIDSFYNFIGYVVLSAPNSFPMEDYLSPDEQMGLERAFDELRTGLQYVDAEGMGGAKRESLSSLLDASLKAYRAGDEVSGAHFLQDLQDLVFKREK